MAQRTGISSRIIYYPETTPDTDPGSPVGYVLPIDSADSAMSAAPLQEAPVYMGNAGEAPSTVPGETTFSGATNLGLEFLTIGYILKALFGSSAAAVATGGKQMHYFPFAAPMLSGQLQKEWAEPTAQYMRNRGVYVDTLTLPVATSGAQKANVTWMGFGDEVQTTDLAGTKTNNGYNATSSFYGQFTYQGGSPLATVVNFSPALTRKPSRQSVAFNAGIAGGINTGMFRTTGPLQLLFDTTSNLNVYNDAINAVPLLLECVWADQVLSSVGAFLYLAITRAISERHAPSVGGEPGLTFQQNFRSTFDSTASQLAPFALSGLGPFNVVVATSDALGIKIDGGSTQVVTLTPGAARTAAQIVANINSLPLVGGTAELFPGNPAGALGQRFRIKSATKGVTGSVQIDTTTTHSAHTVLGLDATVRAGKAAQSVHAFLFNNQSAQY